MSAVVREWVASDARAISRSVFRQCAGSTATIAVEAGQVADKAAMSVMRGRGNSSLAIGRPRAGLLTSNRVSLAIDARISDAGITGGLDLLDIEQ